MRSVALSVIAAIAAVTLQGCEWMNQIANAAEHVSFSFSECEVRVDEVTNPKKKEALDDLPAACQECCSSSKDASKKCLDKGAEIIEQVHNLTKLNYTLQCVALVANSTDITKKKNESTSEVPTLAQEFVEEHKSTIQEDVQGIFDELLEEGIKKAKEEDFLEKEKKFPGDFTKQPSNFMGDFSVYPYRAQMLPNSRWARPLFLQGAVAVVLFAAALVAWRRRAQARNLEPAELLVAE